ncbi:MAG: hypothetical protein IJN94_08460 [Clostridia bacterium]|nr:hypothetical protein [Clostridia bacterium]
MKIAIEHFLTKQNINDDLFYSSLISELEEIIEEELSKDIDEMNAELIDDCCIAIENLQNVLRGEATEAYQAFSGVERIIKHHNKKLRSVYVGAVACAAVAVLCAITSVRLTNQNAQGTLKLNSFLDNIFNIYEHSATTTQAQTTENEQTTVVQTTDPTSLVNNETTSSVPLTTENQVTQTQPEITKPVPHIYKVTAIVPPGFKTEYTDVSQIKLNGVAIKVYYSDNTEKVVSVDECDVKIGTPDKNGKTEITITYKYFDTSIYVNVKAEEERNPLTLNSIYGTFDGSYSVEGMRVYAVYSDGSEKEITKGKYTVKREYSEDFEADIVIVEYGGCSFQFLPEN